MTEFDAPDAGGNTAFAGTWPLWINSEGVITGFYTDTQDVGHGFVRARDGTIEVWGGAGAAGYMINDTGEIVGVDWKVACDGLVGTSKGHITEFSVPGAGTGAGQGTFAWAINFAGTVTGFYWDANNVTHGFVRAPEGKITKFDAPDAGTAAGQGTTGGDINIWGVIAGYYVDANNVTHGFLRMP